MAATDELASERDRRKGVARLAERGQEKAARRPQSASASARTISPRPSTVAAIGLTISVPTPASR